ncbi:MAG: hypothetical protein FJZ01_10225 [Candidatus Sericytochromatia bacterium]|nr:hypothetical protein [Candidatus Tanganyikabacteria bacterium]
MSRKSNSPSRSLGSLTIAALLASGCARLPSQAIGQFFPLPTGAAPVAASPGSAANVPAAAREADLAALVKHALLKDAADGFALADAKSRPYGVQFLAKPVDAVETRRADGLWNYEIVESPTAFRLLQTAEPATRSAEGFFVPDERIVRNLAFTVERELPVPPEAPAGAKAMRVGVEIAADPSPIRGTLGVDRVYLPGQGGARDREIAQQHVSRNLRFHAPGLAALHDKPFVIKRFMARYIPIPTALTDLQARHLQVANEDVPLTLAEEQVWPDGTVVQHQTHVADDLGKIGSKGTIIMADAARTPLVFERAIDLVAGTSVTVLRFLTGETVVLAYDKGGRLAAGRVEADGGRKILGSITAKTNGVATLTLADGTSRDIRLD